MGSCALSAPLSTDLSFARMKETCWLISAVLDLMQGAQDLAVTPHPLSWIGDGFISACVFNIQFSILYYFVFFILNMNILSPVLDLKSVQYC